MKPVLRTFFPGGLDVAKRKKIVWKEGMFLQPQHFQQADRFFDQALVTQWMYQNPFFSGVGELSFDDTALENGAVTLTSCTGVLSDGTVFSIPGEDDPPPSRSFVEHFTHEQQSCDVFLALPLTLEGRPNVAPDTAEGVEFCRFRGQTGTFVDEVSGSLKKQIETGVFNFSLLFSGEKYDNCATLRIARLKRNASGRIGFQEDFIPPLARIGGSRRLTSQLRSLLELLLSRSAFLSQSRKEGRGGKAAFSSADETSFRLLSAINTFTPLLNNYLSDARVHPFELYKYLAQLAGTLTVFSAEVSLKDVCNYDHANLSGTFGPLIRVIRTVLDTGPETGCVVVPFEQVSQTTYLCKPEDNRLLRTARFYLGVSARVPEKELIISVVQRVKISSRDRLDLLIASAMPGLPLLHTAHPLEALPTKPGFLYFAFDQQNQVWRDMQSAGSIAFYFPNSYPDLKVEVFAIKDA